VDDDGEFQVRHFHEGLHAGFIGLVFEFFFDGDVSDAASGAGGGKMNRLDAGNVFFDNVIYASFFRDTSEIPVVHVTRPEIFDNAVPSIGDSRDLNDRYLHFYLVIAEDFAKGVLGIADVWRNLTLDNYFGVRWDKKLIAPSGRRRKAQRFVQKRRGG